jgi:hypothetical protein
MIRLSKIGWVVTIVFLFVTVLQAANTAPVGGGSTRAGFDGEYFANTSFSGTPVFTRRDVRINHDWREASGFAGLPVGGATTPGMADFPKDNFSIRWTGAVVPRFSETYTFRVTGRDGVRFKIGPAGGSLTTLVDKLSASGVYTSAYAMVTGVTYDVVFEYVDQANTGASEARLAWSSPSTPEEIIEPLSFAQSDMHLANPRAYCQMETADLMRMPAGATGFSDLAGTELTAALGQIDTNGWPLVSDSKIILSNTGLPYTGKWKIVLRGQAAVKISSTFSGSWNTAEDGSGTSYNATATVPKGAGYDGTNTTLWLTATKTGPLTLTFTGAERAAGQPGLAELRVYCPVAEGASQTHQLGELYTRDARNYFKDFVVVRQHIGTSQNKGWIWDQRTLPSYCQREHPDGWGYCLEEILMMANDIGKDLHICCGAGWDEDFMKKFALMVRYGSDGVNPYTNYVANPVYPPLNPNLRIYIEHANELPWAVYPTFIWNDFIAKAATNHPDWQIVNYDGKCTGLRSDTTGMLRYHVLRMKQLSDAFRTVNSDVPAAIGDRARILCFGQYAGSFVNTMLQFIDNYFNKADPLSTYTGTAHPPDYYFWGAGGAIYYGSSNRFGLTGTNAIVNGGFEEADLPAGTALFNPTNGGGWTFSGQAGLCDIALPSVPAIAGQQLPASPEPDLATATWSGFKFTVGPNDLYVYELGRWVLSGNDGDVLLAIYNTNGTQVAANNSYFDLVGKTPGTYAYIPCSISAYGFKKACPARLSAGATYYLVAKEASGYSADRFYGAGTQVTAAPGITIQAAVQGTNGVQWTETDGSHAFGPVNMIFTTNTLAAGAFDLGVPPIMPDEKLQSSGGIFFDREFTFGTQCAFLKGTGSVSRTFTVTEEGNYWILLNFCRQPDAGNLYERVLHVDIDGQYRTPNALLNSGYGAMQHVWHYGSSEVVHLTAGQHTVTVRLGDADGNSDFYFIDTLELCSEQAFYGGPDAPNFPIGGNALGATAGTEYYLYADGETTISRNWGLVPMTYEGGWSVQADFDDYAMDAWKNLQLGGGDATPELTKQALRNAFDVWCRAGGYIYAYYYPVAYEVNDTNAPLLECVREYNNRLAAAPEAGSMLPAALLPSMRHSQGSVAGTFVSGWFDGGLSLTADLPARSWKSWIVTAPQTADYKITVRGAGAVELLVDNVSAASGTATADPRTSVSATVRLTAGVHAIKVQSAVAAVKVDEVTVSDSELAVLVAPANRGLIINPDISLQWIPGSGITGQKLYLGTNPVPGTAEQVGTLTSAANAYDPGTLTGGRTYYWRVDSLTAGGTVTGEVWSFSTVAYPETFSGVTNPPAAGWVRPETGGNPTLTADGNRLLVKSVTNSSTAGALKSFSPVTLANTGDRLELQYTVMGTNWYTTGRLRFGFLNALSPVTADVAEIEQHTAYFGSLHEPTTTSKLLKSGDTSSNGDIFAVSTQVFLASNGNFRALANGVDHVITFTLERTASGIQLTETITGGTVGANTTLTVTDTNSVYETFNAVVILAAGRTTENDYSIDDVSVRFVPGAVAPSGTYGFWAAEHGLASDSMLDESPAGDGIKNLMKYALGISPTNSGLQGRLEQAQMDLSGTNWFMLRYVRPEPAPADITYSVQVIGSLLLSNWVNGVEVSSTVSNSLRTITVRDPLPMSGNTNRFLRLKVIK